MPDQMPSQYQIDQNLRRNSDQQAQARQRATRSFRAQVERAIELATKAARLEWLVGAYDGDTNGFQARVHADRIDWNLRLVFWGTILAYVFLEFISCGDIAEVLAHQMAPQFAPDLATGETPLWLRRLAGVGFVGGMLLATLLVKLVATWFLGVASKARAAVMPGEHLRYWGLTAGILGIQLSKVAYVAAVAGLYFWLFGFAQERAHFMAELAAEQKQDTEFADLGFTLKDGSVETTDATGSKPAEVGSGSTKTRLAGATGVFYSVIVLLHALVLLLPTNGFTRELELAHFKRGKAESKFAALREDEQRTLREVYERIRLAPDGLQQDFIAAAAPVIPSINSLYGRTVIQIPEDGQNPTFNGTGPDAGAAPMMAAPSPRTSNGPVGAHATMQSGADESSSDEVPATNWDAIFPGAQRA